jgi:hypothetical protein
LTPPSCQVIAALLVCFPACSLEVRLMPEKSALHPHSFSFRSLFLSDCVCLQRGRCSLAVLRSLDRPSLKR